MEPKALVAIVAFLFALISYGPYLRDMLRGVTKPHAYTWLIWTLTNGTAAAGAWYGGGGYGAVGQLFGAGLTGAFFLLSLRYGTKNVTRSDGVILAVAILAIFLWWILENPLLSVLLVTAIDAIAYIPSFRKSYEEPWSESLLSWNTFTFSAILSVVALQEYNVLTLSYLLMTIFANLILVSLCAVRRRIIPKPV